MAIHPDPVEIVGFGSKGLDPAEKSRQIFKVSGVERAVLDKGFVRLDDYMADDLSVVNSARVSFGVKHEQIEDGDAGLIRYLISNRHGTPFEHNAFRIHIKAPISVFREWQRHRIGSYNELSARYKEMVPEFYVPFLADFRGQVGKPGAYTFEPMEQKSASEAALAMRRSYTHAYETYIALMDAGVAKELARQVLPVGLYSEMYWTTNARSMMNFLSLRNAPTAMLEIRRYAEVVEDLFRLAMPITAQAFVDNGRVAP